MQGDPEAVEGGGQMTKDWIDEERNRRAEGYNRPLLQSQHAEVNARYPGCTLEYCCECDQPTGRAGRTEDSLFTEDDRGPFCSECWDHLGLVDKCEE